MTAPMARVMRLSGVSALITLAGCFSLARPTPPMQEFVLGGAPPTAAGAAAHDSNGITVGLRRLDLAPYLATTAIVVRRASRIETSGFRRWGEEPSAGIMRAVAVSLRAQPSIFAVDVAPWQVRTTHDYLVQLHIAHLEGVASDNPAATAGEVHVMASWEIIRAAEATIVARGTTDHHEPDWRVGDYLGLVTRIDQGLTKVAGDVAACLARLGPVVSAPKDSTAVARVMLCGVR
jgi:uncharacterized lipoprotein YmbA